MTTEQKLKLFILALLLGCSLSSEAQHATNEEVEEIEAIEAMEEIGSQDILSVLIPVHAALAGLCTLQILIAILIARRRSKDNHALPKHKTLGLSSVPLLFTAVFVSYTMLGFLGELHFLVFHAWVGLAVCGLILLVPLLGISMFLFSSQVKMLRQFHKCLGWLLLLLLLFACGTGIVTAYA